jgi:hypothetical protein
VAGVEAEGRPAAGLGDGRGGSGKSDEEVECWAINERASYTRA